VSPTDPLSYVGISLVLLTVGLVASYVPARRAARVEPAVALR
jgi:putative ABC transport system permease protein